MSGIGLVVVLAAPALLFWTWSRPAAAPPLEMPPLVLTPRAVDAQLAEDGALARTAPPEGEDPATRLRLYREANVAEVEGDSEAESRARDALLAGVVSRIRERSGARAIAAMRARDLETLERSLARDASLEPELGGGFVRMMERYGLVAGGRQVAPRFVVRTLFKARWNARHGLPLTEGLSRVERQAYWGWLALRAEPAPVERRLEALEGYAAAGGVRSREAKAVLLYDAGRFQEAREAFDRAYAETPTYRLRNHALACAELDEESRAP